MTADPADTSHTTLQSRLLEEHAIAIDAGKIIDILPQAEAHAQYQATHWVERHQHIVLPGLINLHSHAGMTLLRGVGDDLPLQSWLREKIWPLERQFVTPEFVFDGTQLACMEMLRGGVTCFNDMYFYPDAAIRAAQSIGLRIIAGLVVIDFATQYASDASDYLQRGLACRDQWHNEPGVYFTLAPHAPYTVADATWQEIRTLAEQLNLPIQTHLHETQQELHDSQQQHGCRPLERLAQLDVLGPNFIGIHGTHFTDAELARLAQYNCALVHCPTSNLKLASGIANLHGWQTSGLRFGFGTDSAASNNRLDLWQEMRLANLLAKGHSTIATTLAAYHTLHAATQGAASVLGLDHEFGSITVGKAADLCTVTLDDWIQQPVFDPISHLVYVASREQVTDVWAQGQHVVEAQQFKLPHMPSDLPNNLLTRIQKWQASIMRQASI